MAKQTTKKKATKKKATKKKTAKTGAKATKKTTTRRADGARDTSKSDDAKPAPPEPKRAGKRKPEQTTLLEPSKKNDEIEELSRRLDDERWNRMEWARREQATSNALIAKLRELGLPGYERDGVHVELVEPEKAKVKVRIDVPGDEAE